MSTRHIAIAGMVLCGLATGCSKSITLKSTTPPASGSWTTPVRADYAAYSSGTSPLPNEFSQTFSDFRLKSDGTMAALVGGFCDETSCDGSDTSAYLAFGRAFFPASGWSTASDQFSVLNETPGNYPVFGLSSQAANYWVVQYGGSDIGSHAQPYFSGSSWGTGADVDLDVLGLPSAMGHPTASAWDPVYGSHVYAYTTGANQPQLYFSSGDHDGEVLDLPGKSGNSTESGQFEALNDGLGTTVLWTGNEPFVGKSVAVGKVHACALTVEGSVYCWGSTSDGKLGSNFAVGVTKSLPVRVPGLNGVAALTAGDDHTCALLTNRQVYCWGSNANTQLGAGCSAGSCTNPVLVKLDANPLLAMQISAGGAHTCAVAESGKLLCWGGNDYGQLGDGTVASKADPTEVNGIDGSAVEASAIQVAGGQHHTCALLADWSVKCWGANDRGQVGDGQQCVNGDPPANCVNPTEVVDLDGSDGYRVRSLTAGGAHTCAIVENGRVSCWGDNAKNQLSTACEDAGDFCSTPIEVNGIAEVDGDPYAKTIAAGVNHTCVRLSDESVKCWGENGAAQAGLGHKDSVPDPEAVTAESATLIAAGGDHTCAVIGGSTIKCWGANNSLQNGNDIDANANLTPTVPYYACGASGVGCALNAAWSRDEFFGSTGSAPIQVISTRARAAGDGTRVKGFDAAADGSGNVVVVYLEDVSPAPTCSGIASGCQTQVFAAVRGATGEWVGPTPLDADVRTLENSTLYQDWDGSASGSGDGIGGRAYASPSVAYVGDGKFLVVYTFSDMIGYTNSLYYRIYTVGEGWDSGSTAIDSFALSTTATQAYRRFNDLRVTADGKGNALLIAHYANYDPEDVTQAEDRTYQYRAYRYGSSGGWGSPVEISAGAPQICVGTDSCATQPRFEAVLFPTGQATVVFSHADESDSTVSALYSVDYR